VLVCNNIEAAKIVRSSSHSIDLEHLGKRERVKTNVMKCIKYL
jgi:hypothetical protein